MEARAARFDEEDQLKKLRTQKVQERNAKLSALQTNSSSTKEPACWGMCPEFEMIDRQVTNDVSLFEAQVPFNPPQGKLIIDPRRAVKKFRRSAAGNYELAEDLRPPEVLLATTIYLMRDVLGDEKWPANSVPFAALYAFIRDRLRAIRTDLTLQNCKNLSSVRIHEISIRFLIAAGHLLCEEERAAFEPQQNNEQLNGCLSALREMYKTVRLTASASASEFLKYEAEFQAYSIILSVDKKEAAVAISALPVDLLQNESIQVALEAYSAFQQTNYIKFMNLIKDDPRTTYLQACLLHQFVLPVRQRALSAIISLPEDFKTISKIDLANWLAFVDEEEVAYYSDRFGFKLIGNQVDFSALISRGEVYDLRAEEENFKIRKFEVAIEQNRRKNSTLTSIMFEGIDLDLNSAMNVLNKKFTPFDNTNSKNVNITSEFLAAASSPTSRPKKTFQTKASSLGSSLEIQKPAEIFTPQLQNSSQVPEITPEIAKPVIDHKEILRRKLEAQAQERQLRRERIEEISLSMLNALIDSIVGCHVAEICTHTWDNLRREERGKRSAIIEKMSHLIFEDLLECEILPSILDIELIKIRCKAAESFHNRSSQIHQSTFSILNSLENEIYEEVIKDSVLEYREMLFKKRFWFNRIKRTFKETISNWSNIFEIPNHLSQPVHLCFIGDENDALIENILKSNPPNQLGYLQRTNNNNNNDMKMIWSVIKNEFPFILSHWKATKKRLDLFNWPSNFPGPTIIVTGKNDVSFTVNTSEFPWEPKLLRIETFGVEFLKNFINSIVNEPIELPKLNQNLTVSQLIPEELIGSFVFEPYEHECEGESDDLFLLLLKGLLDKIVWVLFKSPQASRLLSWHPITAGRSNVLDSIRKSQLIPDTFLNLFKASKSIQTVFETLDQIYGPVFTCNLEYLYTNQTISDLLRTQKEIVSNFKSGKRAKLTITAQQQQQPHTIDNLREKLRSEAKESEAYEDFLKKFL